MARALILVPGYGTQGGRGEDVAHAFNPDGSGGAVNASRSLTCPAAPDPGCRETLAAAIGDQVALMNDDINRACRRRAGWRGPGNGPEEPVVFPCLILSRRDQERLLTRTWYRCLPSRPSLPPPDRPNLGMLWMPLRNFRAPKRVGGIGCEFRRQEG
jgi:hypothetical protein